MVILLLI
jgi:hypothetical protein